MHQQQHQPNAKKEEEMRRQRERLQQFASPSYLRSHATKALTPDAMITNLLSSTTTLTSHNLPQHKRQSIPPSAPASSSSRLYHSNQTSATAQQRNVSSHRKGAILSPSAVPMASAVDDTLPIEYQRALKAVTPPASQRPMGATSELSFPDTALVYNLMLSSGLSKDALGHIWSLVNRTVPGQLTNAEFFTALALIAQIQRGQPPSLEQLKLEASLPIPTLVLPPQNNHETFAAVSGSQPTTVQGNNTRTVVQSTPILSTVNDSPTNKPSALNELSGLDLSFNVSSTHPDGGMSAMTASNAVDSVALRNDLEARTTDYLSPLEPPGSNNSPCDVLSLSESKEPSVHSLDLKSAKNEDESNSECGDAPKAVIADPVCLVPTVQDKYAVLKEDADGCGTEPESSTDVWLRCLKMVECHLAEAEHLLCDGSSDVVEQVLNTDKGRNYVIGLCHTYRVAMRIRKSAGSNKSFEIEIEGLLTSIMKKWQLLKSTFPHHFAEDVIDGGGEGDVGGGAGDATPQRRWQCGVCFWTDNDGRSDGRAVVFAGGTYHSQCANFWINAVHSLLPTVRTCRQ